MIMKWRVLFMLSSMLKQKLMIGEMMVKMKCFSWWLKSRVIINCDEMLNTTNC